MAVTRAVNPGSPPRCIRWAGASARFPLARHARWELYYYCAYSCDTAIVDIMTTDDAGPVLFTSAWTASRMPRFETSTMHITPYHYSLHP